MVLGRTTPALARGHDGRDVILRCLESRARLTVADSVDGEICSQNERREASLERLLDDVVADTAIAEDVDLEPARRSGRSRCDFLRGGGRDRRDAHERSCCARTARHGDLTFLVRDLLERHRRDECRHRHRRSQDGRLGRDFRHVHEHPGTEPEARERLAIPAQRPLVTRPAHDVAPRLGRDGLLGHALGVVDGEKLLHGRGAYRLAGSANSGPVVTFA